MKDINDILVQIQLDIGIIRNDLQHHIKRTDLAEDNIKLLREENKMQAKGLSNELQPLRKHVHMVEGGLKLIGIMSVVLTITAAIYNLLG